MAGVPTNRTNISLPPEVAAEILARTQEASAVMSLARQIALPGRGVSIPVITADPEAAWVGETEAKAVANPSLSTKVMEPYKLAVIVPFSNEFRRDAAALYDELIRRLPLALAAKFDATVVGAVQAPGSNFDTFAAATAQNISNPNTYSSLVAADADIATHGGIMNGIVLAPQGKAVLPGLIDGHGHGGHIVEVGEKNPLDTSEVGFAIFGDCGKGLTTRHILYFFELSKKKGRALRPAPLGFGFSTD